MVTRRQVLKGLAAVPIAVALPAAALDGVPWPASAYATIPRCATITSAKMTLDMEQYHRRYIKPAMKALASKLEADVLYGK